MAFVKKTWKDRISEYPNRRTINDGVTTKVVTVGRDEGNITQAGDAFNATNMNDLEDRIEAGLAEKPDREEVEDMVEGFFPLDEASGAMVSINPGVMLPLRSCECQINAYQASGTPTPDNPLPITGFSQADISVSGKNLCNWKVNTSSNPLIISLPKGTYTISSDGQSTFGFWYFRFTDIDGNVISDNPSQFGLSDYTYSSVSQYFYGGNNRTDVTFILPDNGYTVRIGTLNGNGTISAMLAQGSTATPYEPYTGNTYLVEFGQTVYGGKINATTGELIVTHKAIDLGTLTWSDSDGSDLHNSSGITDMKNGWYAQDLSGYLCEMFIPKSQNVGWASMVNGEYGTNQKTLRVKWTNISSGADFKTFVSGKYLVYELETPLVYQLTPTQIKTLLNQNNIYHDCNGDIDVIYHKALTAKNIYFDNNGTTLTATNVEDAIKEVLSRI